MKTVDGIKNILAQHKKELADRYKVKEIGIFGSYIRGEQRERRAIWIYWWSLKNLSGLTLLNWQNS